MPKNQLPGEVTVQCNIDQGLTIAWQDTVGRPRTKDELDEQLDLFMAVVGRQRAKLDLSKAMASLAIEENLIKEHGERRVQLHASYQMQHQVSNRRGEFKLTDQQRKALEQCDAEIANVAKSMVMTKANIARLKALIAGEELPEPALAEAAD